MSLYHIVSSVKVAAEIVARLACKSIEIVIEYPIFSGLLFSLANHVDLLICIPLVKSTLPTIYDVDFPLVIGTNLILNECGNI